MTNLNLWLPIGAFALYLYDSILLLHSNELIMERRHSWQVRSGSQFYWKGRMVYLPNPFLPHVAGYRVYWDPSTSGDSSVPAPNFAAIDRLFRGLRPLVIGLLTLLCIVLPAVSWGLGSGWPLLAVFGLCYGLVVAILATVWRQRLQISISNRQFVGLSFDLLACAPFAANVIRKIALTIVAGSTEAISFSKTINDPSAFVAVTEVIKASARKELSQLEEGEPSRQLLGAYLLKLESATLCR